MGSPCLWELGQWQQFVVGGVAAAGTPHWLCQLSPSSRRSCSDPAPSPQPLPAAGHGNSASALVTPGSVGHQPTHGGFLL